MCTFAPKENFWPQNAFWVKQRTFCQIHHFWSPDGARIALEVGVCEFVHAPRGTFCSKSHFCQNSHFSRPKWFLSRNYTFTLKNALLAQKRDFADFGSKSINLAFVLHGLVQNAKTCDFVKNLRAQEKSQKCFLPKRIFANYFSNFRKKCISDVSRFTTQLQKSP